MSRGVLGTARMPSEYVGDMLDLEELGEEGFRAHLVRRGGLSESQAEQYAQLIGEMAEGCGLTRASLVEAYTRRVANSR
jgi:hypothetical protein